MTLSCWAMQPLFCSPALWCPRDSALGLAVSPPQFRGAAQNSGPRPRRVPARNQRRSLSLGTDRDSVLGEGRSGIGMPLPAPPQTNTVTWPTTLSLFDVISRPRRSAWQDAGVSTAAAIERYRRTGDHDLYFFEPASRATLGLIHEQRGTRRRLLRLVPPFGRRRGVVLVPRPPAAPRWLSSLTSSAR